MIYLIVALLVTYGLYGPMLLLFGESSVYQLTSTRTTGGARPEYQYRYLWAVGYDFTARDGRQYSGNTSAIAYDAGPGIASTGRVVYLPAFPHMNMIAKEATPGVGHAALFAFVALLMWLTAPRKPTLKGARADQHSRAHDRSKRKEKAQTHQVALPLSPDQTIAWIRTYRSHSRLYAWGFFVMMIPIVLGIIWLDVRTIDEEVLYSLAFFVVVFLALAIWSRRSTTRSWRGVVHDKYIKTRRVGRGTLLLHKVEQRPMLDLETNGRTLALGVSAPLFDYFSVGDPIFKLSGFDWPEKFELNGESRVCIVCGNILDIDAAVCPRCRAPVPDHSILVRELG